MCGICGVFEFSRSEADVEAVTKMNDSMVHRGPDSDGYVRHGPVAIGVRRLAIIDLEHGDQPLYNEDRTCGVILNGAIYNFREVRAELVRQGHSFTSDGDTEVIVHAYEEWGEDCVKRLRGMFTFAVCDWRDERNTGPTLFVARDRLGVKPLYVAHDNNRFLFASEVRTILAAIPRPHKLSLDGLQTYLGFGSVQEPLTLVDGITSLPPAHWITVDRAGVRTQQYWNFPDPDSGREPISQDELRNKLLESVQIRLVSDVPLGLFLSGGIDSGALAGMMAAVSPETPRAVTVGFREQKFDESALARVTAAQTGIKHDLLLITENDVLQDLSSALRGMDQPTIDGINTWYVSRETKRSSLTVALSGVGGDELFAGYDIFPTALRLKKWQSSLERIPSFLRQGLGRAIGLRSGDRWDKVSSWVRGEAPFGDPYFLTRNWLSREAQVALMPRSWRMETEIGPWSARVKEDMRLASRFDQIGRISLLDMRHYMLSRLLRDTDSMSMSHSLEVRTPFLDHELVEMVLPQSGKMKYTGVSPKPMLVGALNGLIPERVTKAAKRGFNFPWELWLRNQLKKPVHDALVNDSALHEHLDPVALRQVWTTFEAGRTSWSRPWGLFVLNQWLEDHIG